MLQAHLKEDWITKRLLDIYQTLQQHSFQYRVKLQDICLPTLRGLEDQLQPLLHPYIQALS